MIDRDSKPLIHSSSQEIDNSSFDRQFGINVVQTAVYDPTQNQLVNQENTSYGRIKVEEGEPQYIGQHIDPDAIDSDPHWKITKITSDGIRDYRTKIGAWDERATLFT
jgi:hypothetical protein